MYFFSLRVANNFLSEFCRWRSCQTCEVDSAQSSAIDWCSALGSAPIYFDLLFCSFLLLGRAPRASRPTGRSCSCVLRPPRSSDKILSSWKPRSQESVIFSLRRGLGRDNQPTPCAMGFSCERDSHSEPCLGPGESREVGWGFSSKTILLWDPRDVFFSLCASRMR